MITLISILFLIIICALLVLLAFPVRLDEEKKRKVNVARVLSILLPGLGHVLLGNWIRGIIFILVWVGFGLSALVTNLAKFAVGTTSSENLRATLIFAFVLWALSLVGLSGWRKNSIKKASSKNESLN